jgi:uncharacterized protein
MTNFTIPNIPGNFEWRNPPLDWGYDPSVGLSILAGAQTNWFTDPGGNYKNDTAPCALITPTDDNFILSARVAVEFTSTFDAGVIQVREADDLWAKLCFEYSPQNQPMIVSVVTRGVSDDCNSVEINGSEIYLRVSRTPKTLAFHFSHDGYFWQFVRYFTLGEMKSLQVGFSSQSPTGNKCATIFSEISYRQAVLKDNRNGE